MACLQILCFFCLVVAAATTGLVLVLAIRSRVRQRCINSSGQECLTVLFTPGFAAGSWPIFGLFERARRRFLPDFS